MARKILLSCGILSSLLYIAMNIFVPMLYEGYNMGSQTVSELSAIDTPTRPLWIVLAIIYALFAAIYTSNKFIIASVGKALAKLSVPFQEE